MSLLSTGCWNTGVVQTTQGRTALYAVRALIEGKADLNVQAEDGRTSLYEAVVDIGSVDRGKR